MLKLFYKSVFGFYTNRWPQHDPWFYAWMATTLMCAFNGLTIYYAVEYCLKIGCNPLMTRVTGILIAVLLICFYVVKINDTSRFKPFRTIYKFRNGAVWLYIIATVAAMITIANMHRSLLPGH